MDWIDEWKKLIEVSDTLFGPEGCPWDRDQTLISMRGSVLEEACEVIEAIDGEDDAHLQEELGDLLYNVVFFCKVAEKEGRFSLADVLRGIREKLIGRHPHVFGKEKIAEIEGVIERWEQLKKLEKSHRESLLDGIPKGLPALARAFKFAGKMQKSLYRKEESRPLEFHTEDELAQLLWEVSYQAKLRGLNPETALRKRLLEEEEAFRAWEKS